MNNPTSNVDFKQWERQEREALLDEYCKYLRDMLDDEDINQVGYYLAWAREEHTRLSE